MMFLSPEQEMGIVRRSALRAGCRVAELAVRETSVGRRAVGRLECPDGWAAARLLMAEAIEDSRTPGARDVALAIRAEHPDDPSFARAVQQWVKDRVAFVREKGEIFTGSAYTIATAAGDCDDHARVVYAIAEAGGLPAVLAFLYHPDAKDTDPTHAVAQLCVDGRCHWAETTIDAFFGEHPLAAAGRLGLLDEREDLAKGVRIMSEKTLGDQMKADQYALMLLGFLHEGDPVTPAVVKEVQRAIAGLAVDGILGPKTRAAIGLRLPTSGMGYLGSFSADAMGYIAASSSAAADLDEGFYATWIDMTTRLKLDPIDLMRVAFAETALKATAHDPRANGGGLIGFMPATLKSLGWAGTPEEFRKLSATQQIPWVEKYYRTKPLSLLRDDALIYVANFLPALVQAASASDDGFVLTTAMGTGPLQPPKRDAQIYASNKILDRNGDGVIDVGDLRRHLEIQDRGARYEEIDRKMTAAMNARGLTPRPRESASSVAKGVAIVGIGLLVVVGGVLAHMKGWV